MITAQHRMFKDDTKNGYQLLRVCEGKECEGSTAWKEHNAKGKIAIALMLYRRVSVVRLRDRKCSLQRFIIPCMLPARIMS